MTGRRCPGLRFNCSNPFSVVVGDALLRIETPGSGYARAAPHPIARKTLPPQPFAAQSPSIIAQHARLSAAAPSFAALKPEPDTQAHARAAGTLCCGCRCSCGHVCLQCCSSARGSSPHGSLLVGNLEHLLIGSLEHCKSQRGSRISCSLIAAECRSRDLRWRIQYV